MKNDILKKSIFLFSVLSITSCQTLAPELSEEEESLVAQSSIAYQQNNKFDTAKQFLRHYITKNYHKNNLIIEVSPILNKTADTGGELPVDISEMTTTSLNALTVRNKVTLLSYNPDYTIHQRNVYGINRLGEMPTHVISGSITEYDIDREKNSSGGSLDILAGSGTFETDIGIDSSRDITRARITIDFKVEDYKTRRYHPVQTSYSIDLHKVSKNNGFSVSIYGNGMSLNGKYEVNPGLHKVIRNLIDMSMLHLIGDLTELPWKSLIVEAKEGSKVDYTINDPVAASHRKSYTEKTLHERVFLLQKLLQKLIKSKDSAYIKFPNNDVWNSKTEDIIRRYTHYFDTKKGLALPILKPNGHDLYEGRLANLYTHALQKEGDMEISNKAKSYKEKQQQEELNKDKMNVLFPTGANKGTQEVNKVQGCDQKRTIMKLCN